MARGLRLLVAGGGRRAAGRCGSPGDLLAFARQRESV